MKAAIVTGASGGLGSAVARALAKEGYALALAGRNNTVLGDLAHEITQAGGTTMVRTFDLHYSSQVAKFVHDVHEVYHEIDAVVNCAGTVHPRREFESLYLDDLRKTFWVNTFGPFFLMKAVLPLFKEQNRGMIINVASKSARSPAPGFGIYSASKAALVALTQTVAVEAMRSGRNITAITVSPSGMSGRMRASVYGEEEAKQQQSPEFVAQVIASIVTLGYPQYVGGPPVWVNGPIPNGADVLIWKAEVRVFPMEDLR